MRKRCVTWESASTDDYSGIPYTKYIHSLDEDAAIVVGGWRLRAQELVSEVKEGELRTPRTAVQRQPAHLDHRHEGRLFDHPFSADVVASVLPELEGFTSTKGGVKFAEKPLPIAAFDRIVKERQAEIDSASGSSCGGRGR